MLIQLIRNTFFEAIISGFPNSQFDIKMIEITQSTQEKFGHYQFNSAMKLAKTLGKNPREIAQMIVAQISPSNEFIEKLEIAGPGFINITLSPEFLSQQLNKMLKDDHLAIAQPEYKQRIIVDFSSPNIAKEMHVGHLRSTIIGDCLARLFEFLGHSVLRLNHVGDWGTAFGMLIAYMKKYVPEVLDGTVPTDLASLMHWYKESKKILDKDDDFKNSARLEVVKLQRGDPVSLQAWQLICKISETAYQEIYNLLDVKISTRGESFYNPILPEIVADLEKKGLVTLSDGAKCIFLEGFHNREGDALPLMVQKSDGGFNYDTTDMAAMRQRTSEEKADRIIIVTDAGQSTHFAMIVQASIKAGYLEVSKTRFDHVPFGLVLGSDGKKFRTRSGDTEKLIDLLNAAIAQAKKILKEREPDLSDQEVDIIGKALGIGAVKYADLSSNRVSDYVFSYDRMLRFDGNTAAFLMYSYVRIAGIKRKIVNVDMKELKRHKTIELTHPSEIQLALHLLQFEETLNAVQEELLPHYLTEYLYLLAQKFNAFFRDCRVEGTAEQSSRLLLCELIREVLAAGFSILGLQTLEKM